MVKKFAVLVLLVAVVAGGIVTAAPRAVAQDEFVFGVVLVGPKDDHGWSQAHYDAGLYVEENLPGSHNDPAGKPELGRPPRNHAGPGG